MGLTRVGAAAAHFGRHPGFDLDLIATLIARKSNPGSYRSGR